MISDRHDLCHTKNLYSMMYFLLWFLSMHNIFIFVELSNNIFYLFINNVFQSCKIILEYFSRVCLFLLARALVLIVQQRACLVQATKKWHIYLFQQWMTHTTTWKLWCGFIYRSPQITNNIFSSYFFCWRWESYTIEEGAGATPNCAVAGAALAKAGATPNCAVAGAALASPELWSLPWPGEGLNGVMDLLQCAFD
jgi:hypothetical protein